MPVLVEEFARVSELFREPVLLVSSDARLRAANADARGALLHGVVPDPDDSLFRFLEGPHDAVLDYLRVCSRSAQPLPGVLSFRGETPAQSTADYRCAGSAFPSRDERGRPLVLLRLAPKAVSNRFVALNQQIDQLRAEVARRVSAERIAYEQRELLRVTLSSIGDAVITTDVAGRITFMNPVAESHTGWTLADALERRLDEVFVIRSETSREPVESPVERVLRSGHIVGLANHTVLVRKDQTELPIDDSGAPIRDALDNILGVVLVFHDISERRSLERELMAQTHALQETDRLKDEFLAMLAHELRNPLAPLRNCVQILRSQPIGTVPLERLIAMMERQTNQLTRLVDDLLDVARITRGTISLQREPVRLCVALEHAIEIARSLIDERRHRLEMNPPPQDLIVEADLTRLVQIVSNLLTNAAKFTEPGGEIFLSTSQQRGRAIVSIRDTGIGLSQEALRHVFEMFRQENKSLDRAQGGLGVGLTVVKKLLNMHGGDIEAHSEGIGRGAEFRFWIPIVAPGASRTESMRVAGEARTEARVLIVDDNVDGAESLGMLLRTWGCDVRVAHEGHGAIQLAREFEPSIVLLDIGLPGMDGFEVARRLRRLSGMAAVRMIAITGYGSELDRARSHDAGIDHHLTKPVDLGRLQQLLGK